MKYSETIEHGCYVSKPDIEPGMRLVEIGSPSHTTCPYDVYARIFAQDVRKALQRHKVDATVVLCHRRAIGARGTGPEGRRRFGDDMIPPIIAAIAREEGADMVMAAWEAYTFRKYMNKPHHIVGNKMWTGRAWVETRTWPLVVANALHLAERLKLDTTALRRYAQRVASRNDKTLPA